MNQRRKLLLTLGAGALGMMALVGQLIWTSYREALHAAEVKSSDYAAILETRLDATLRRADAELQQLAPNLPAAAPGKPASPLHAGELDAALKSRLINFPEVAALHVFDADGEMISATDSNATTRANISDREHFRKARDDRQNTLIFSEALIARATGKPTLVMVRALRDGEGAFRGVVTATLDLDYWLKLFQAVNVGASGTIAIYRSDDFTQLLRWPQAKGKVNVALPPDSPLRSSLASGRRSAVLEMTAATDGIMRLYSFQALAAYPFFVSVGSARNDALASWRRDSLAAGVFALLLMGLLAALLARLWRADAARARLGAIVDATNDAIVSRDATGKVLSWNRGAEMLFGYSAAEMLGRDISVLAPPELHRELRIGEETTPDFQARSHDSVRFARDGRKLEVSISAAPIRDRAGSVSAVALIFRDITARKQAEAAMQESEARFRATFEQAAVGIAHLDPELRVIRVNRRYCEITGYAAEELLGRLPGLLTHPDDQGIGTEQRQQLQAGAIEHSMQERRYLRKDGKAIWVTRTESLVRDGAGTPLYYIRVIEDSTERKETDERFRATFDNAPVGIMQTDLDTDRILHANRKLCEMLGYTQDELLAMTTDDILHPGYRGTDREKYREKLLGGEIGSYSSERLYRRKDGASLWVNRTVSRANDAAGKPLYLIRIIEDITERKHAEAALRESEARFRDIAEAAGGYTWEIGLDYRYTFVSERSEKLFGYLPAEMLGRDPAEFMAPGELARLNVAVAKRQMADGSMRSLEYRIVAKSGALCWHQVHIVPMHDAAGALTGYRGTGVDITERKEAEATHASLEAQLRESQKMEAIGTLAGGIAHDFNNIIATILGNVELARGDAAGNPRALESLQEILKAGTRARDLVQQILSFSRRQPAERKRIDLAPVLHESARLLRATLPPRLTFEVHCEPEAPAVLADANQIQQALLNLVNNAMQAMPRGAGHITVRLDSVTLDAALAQRHPKLLALHAVRPGRSVRLAVSDSGPGMDAAMQARIFEPFFTTKPVGEGTGLGLSVVHGIVQGHEGAIVVDSQPGKGATFTLYLPAAPALADPAAADLNITAKIPVYRGSEGKHVLYLDDDEALVFLVKRLLERNGYRISAHTDQQAALDALRAAPFSFDLVVTDYNMPGMSGLDVVREVRALRPDLPVAITSGFIDETLNAQAAAAGARELIFKANSVEAFCEAVERLAHTVGPQTKSVASR